MSTDAKSEQIEDQTIRNINDPRLDVHKLLLQIPKTKELTKKPKITELDKVIWQHNRDTIKNRPSWYNDFLVKYNQTKFRVPITIMRSAAKEYTSDVYWYSVEFGVRSLYYDVSTERLITLGKRNLLPLGSFRNGTYGSDPTLICICPENGKIHLMSEDMKETIYSSLLEALLDVRSDALEKGYNGMFLMAEI